MCAPEERNQRLVVHVHKALDDTSHAHLPSPASILPGLHAFESGVVLPANLPRRANVSAWTAAAKQASTPRRRRRRRRQQVTDRTSHASLRLLLDDGVGVRELNPDPGRS